MSLFPHLLSSIRIGPRAAKNRIMRVATTANLADHNRVGARVLAFYRALAKGGAGTIVTEALRTQPQDPFGPGCARHLRSRRIEGLRRIADVCHAEDALLIGQLNMAGASTSPPDRALHDRRRRRSPVPAGEAFRTSSRRARCAR